ncbi:MAG: polynucleotide adenylyltransferase PcnB [Planctomycetes bacterium]|nr:polynucleotide adenylyltransferase PcnB [Planctomycetota bacterium]
MDADDEFDDYGPRVPRRPRALHEGGGGPGAPRVIPADSIPHEVLDQDALRVISRLERQGHEAYLVGGCVRDLLIGRRPKDYDVATSAHPRQIKRLFRNGRIIGRRFRLVHIYYGAHIVETATFRRDPPRMAEGEDDARAVEPESGDIHPEEFDDLLITEDNEYGTAEEDARRRDFTVNALFLDPLENRIIDYVGGLDDLDAGVLRTIGDAKKRIAEDPVRILRAIKFATRLGFRIEERTWEAMSALAPSLARSAPPRVLEEILRLLRSGTALGAFRMMRACGALRVILPQVDHYLGAKDDAVAQERADGFWRLLEALDNDVHSGYVPSTAVCLALLFLRIVEREAFPDTRTLPGPPPDLVTVTGEVLEDLANVTRLPRREVNRARRIILQQRRFTQTSTKRFRPLAFMRSEEFPEALELFRLRVAARGQGWDIYEGWKERHAPAREAPPEELDGERKKTRRRRRRGGRGRNAALDAPEGAPEPSAPD